MIFFAPEALHNEKEHVECSAGHGKRAQYRSFRAENRRAERDANKAVVWIGHAAGENKRIVLIQPEQFCDWLGQKCKQNEAGHISQCDLNDLRKRHIAEIPAGRRQNITGKKYIQQQHGKEVCPLALHFAQLAQQKAEHHHRCENQNLLQNRLCHVILHRPLS